MLSLAGLRANIFVAAVVLLCALVVVFDRIWLAPVWRILTTTLWAWVILLAGCAALLGVLNVLVVHLRRVVFGAPGWANSLVLVATALAVLVLGLVGTGGSRSAQAEWVYDALLAPGLATLFAMTAFFTVAAAYRYLRVGSGYRPVEPDTPDPADPYPESKPGAGDREETEQPAPYRSQGGGWMLSGALLFLVVQTPMLQGVLPAGLAAFAGWVLDVPAMAALRGALMGAAVAFVVTGLRLAVTGK